MPDVAMCHGGDCPLKNRCFRYRARPSDPWQSYFSPPPFDPITGECARFSSLKGWGRRDGSGPYIRSLKECRAIEKRAAAKSKDLAD